LAFKPLPAIAEYSLKQITACGLVSSLVGDELMKHALVSGKKGCETVVECAEIIE
jgi:hypothetical protein